MQGSLYWLLLRALAAIWLVRAVCLPPTGLGEEQGPGGATLMAAVGTRVECEACRMEVLGGHRGDPGTFL